MSNYLFALCLLLICGASAVFAIAFNHLFGTAGLPVMILGSFAIGWFGGDITWKIDRKLKTKRAHLEAK